MVNLVTQEELAAAGAWQERAFRHSDGAHGAGRFPVSFCYDGRDSADLMGGWSASAERPRTRDGAVTEVFTFSDRNTGLECRCTVKSWPDFPAVEWVGSFQNGGKKDTPIISDIMALDVLFALDPAAPCQVHHARGGLTQKDDFEPLATPLTFRQGGSRLEVSARTGKSSTLHLPFFNLQLGAGGVVAAVGWTGGWSAVFQRDREGIRVRAGMERTHLRLHPAEEIRTPRILLLFWQGPDAEDRTRSQNILRRLLLRHYTPRPNGETLLVPFCEGAWGAQPEAAHLEKIRWLQDNRIPAECYWIDAGWYGERPLAEAADALSSGWMRQVGSWNANAEAYPRGLSPVSSAARKAGLGFLLWLEPERVFEGTRLFRDHPDWLIGPVPSGGTNGMNYMVNLGNTEARRYVTDLVSTLISEQGITCYRQDFNDLRVPELFAVADAPDRVGMAEIRHITGLYAFWDELLARHPGLVIDNCAGGGQRIDLETMGRSVPLWRSDLQCWPFDPIAMQTQTQGLAPWVPLSAAVCDTATRYAMRSALGPGLVTHWSQQAVDNHRALPVEEIRAGMSEALAMRTYFSGDFYPLLSFSLAEDAWAAWQYDRPDLGEGMIVAFRRQASPFALWVAAPRALEAEAEYELTSWDGDGSRRMSGRELMTDGFAVTIAGKPGSALFTYKRRNTWSA
jgi:alpha-galactosidase